MGFLKKNKNKETRTNPQEMIKDKNFNAALEINTKQFLNEEFIAKFAENANAYYASKNAEEKIYFLKIIANQLFANMLSSAGISYNAEDVDEKIVFVDEFGPGRTLACYKQDINKIIIYKDIFDQQLMMNSLGDFISVIIHEITHYIQSARGNSDVVYPYFKDSIAENQSEHLMSLALKYQLFINLNTIKKSPEFLNRINNMKEHVRNSNFGPTTKKQMIDNLNSYAKPLTDNEIFLLQDSFYRDDNNEKEAFYNGDWLAAQLIGKVKEHARKNKQVDFMKIYDSEEKSLNSSFNMFIHSQQANQNANNVYNLIALLSAKEFIKLLSLNNEQPFNKKSFRQIPEDFEYNPMYKEFITQIANYGLFEMFKKGASWENNQNELIEALEQSNNLTLKLQFAEFGLQVSTIQEDFKSLIMSNNSKAIAYKPSLYSFLNKENQKLLSNHIKQIDNMQKFDAFNTPSIFEKYECELIESLNNINKSMAQTMNSKRELSLNMFELYFNNSFKLCSNYLNKAFENKKVDEFDIAELEKYAEIFNKSKTIIAELLNTKFENNYSLAKYNYLFKNKYVPLVSELDKKIKEIIANAPGGMQ